MAATTPSEAATGTFTRPETSIFAPTNTITRARPTVGRPRRLRVGIADVIPKLVAHRLLAPVLELPVAPRLVCVEDRHERLLAALALHELDVVLTDTPVGQGAAVRAYNHALGECGVTFFAAPRLAAGLRGGFPSTLDGAPFLLPAEGRALRRALGAWFESHGVRPSIAGEFDDSALLKVFGEEGAGVFTAPTPIADEVERRHGVLALDATDEVRERFWAISVDRRLKHPAVAALVRHGIGPAHTSK